LTADNTPSNTTLLLVDNGSTRVEAALQLKKIASKLSDVSGLKIHAVSLKHSDKIPADHVDAHLDGIKARVFNEFIEEHLKAGQRNFILIPLFFGKSRALTSFVPDEKEKLESQFGSFSLNMTDVLYPIDEGSPALVNILYEHAVLAANGDTKAHLKNIVLVDHGSPIKTVNDVRQGLAHALKLKLPEGCNIDQAAMERRPGKEYDFNGELLEDYLNRLAKAGETKATILLQFLLSGTHAGANGDIEQICHTVMSKYPGFKVSISPLIGQNDQLVTLLAEKLKNHLARSRV